MFRKWLLSHNLVLGIIKTPKFHPFIQHQHFSFPFSPSTFCSTTTSSDTHPFAVSYLINNFGFSTKSALRAFNQRQVRFQSPDNPNSVINFFKDHHFSHSNIRRIVRKVPWLLQLKPHKALLQKYQFFLSKGVSSTDTVSLLTANPKIFQISLECRIIPLFELLSRFLKTNKDVINCLIRYSYSSGRIPDGVIKGNINLISDFGADDSVIARLLQTRPSIFTLPSYDLIKSLEEVKGLGFDPSTITFRAALMSNKCKSKKLWDEKFDTFKKWGWSDETVFKVFRLQPDLLSVSVDKINLVMNFWVNQLGWDSSALAKPPTMFTYSLHERIIPRALVLQYLLMKGLRNKNASLLAPFRCSEQKFLKRCVFSFKRESDYLLKLYEEKMKLEYTEENNGMPLTK